ncbi:unnamed protein product [Polarella glacialis]|uniref:Uncharacterized protein n=1 Tax=Polarella glacialis TaxID=89957 RepID=A0A813HT10_POLGL|nr:unnamed protein product [Polarella glacialis]
MMLASCFLAVLAVLAGAVEDPDIGYSLLFETAPEEFSRQCVDVSPQSKPFPTWASGDFIIPSIGVVSMGDRTMVGLLDPFGKMQRFEMKGSTVCAAYRIMATGFYNASKALNTVAPSLLFYETDPPRDCPMYNPMCNMMPHVNTFKVGSKMLSITDAPSMLEIRTLQVLKKHQFDADRMEETLPYAGSAHPVNHPVTGDWIDFVGNANLLTGGAQVNFFHLSGDNPTFRHSLGNLTFDHPPYMHSFGVTEHYLVLPRMPVELNILDILYRPLSAAFKDLKMSAPGIDNAFVLLPLDGSGKVIRAYLPLNDMLYYVHTVNAYENATDIVIDLTTSSHNPFASHALTLPSNKDKAMRDTFSPEVVKRFVIPLQEGQPVVASVISDPRTSTDFTKINPRLAGKKHCFFWAVENKHDGESYASIAIVKYDLCYGSPAKHWFRQSWYPSEATMIPSPEPSAAEDDGLLVFTALDGAADQSYLVTVDAQTFVVKSQITANSKQQQNNNNTKTTTQQQQQHTNKTTTTTTTTTRTTKRA